MRRQGMTPCPRCLGPLPDGVHMTASGPVCPTCASELAKAAYDRKHPPASHHVVDNPPPPEGFTGALSTNGNVSTPLVGFVDSPPTCTTCSDTGHSGNH